MNVKFFEGMFYMATNSFFSILGTIALLLPACSTEKRDTNITPAKNTESNERLIDVDYKKQLIDKLVTAFADEWTASYQYWVAAKLVQGAKTQKVTDELTQHHKDELRHADMLANRLVELGGDFRIFPQDWHAKASCHYDSITDTNVKSVLNENINGEKCAINFYQDLLSMVKGKDQKTFNMVQEILNDEIEHKQDLEKLQKMH